MSVAKSRVPRKARLSQERLAALAAEGKDDYRAYLTAQIMLAQATAEAVGLTSADFFGLNIVGLRGQVTAGELATATGLTSGAATRMIDRLEAAGFVRRAHDTTDRRRVLIELAPRRQDEIDAVLEPGRRRIAEVFRNFNEEQVRVLFEYFRHATPAMLAVAADLQRRR